MCLSFGEVGGGAPRCFQSRAILPAAPAHCRRLSAISIDVPVIGADRDGCAALLSIPCYPPDRGVEPCRKTNGAIPQAGIGAKIRRRPKPSTPWPSAIQ